MAYQTIANWCLNCATSDLPNDDLFKQLMLQAACSIIAGGGGGGGSGIVVVESCLIVTTGGAWGSVGDIINALQFFDTATDPPTLTSTTYFNTTTQAVVTGVTAGNTSPCPDEALGNSCTNPVFTKTCVDNESGTLTSASVTTSTSIIAGFYSVSVINVGNANGVVDGQPLLPGETFNLTGYWSPASNTFRLTPAISIDGTGTTLRTRTFG